MDMLIIMIMVVAMIVMMIIKSASEDICLITVRVCVYMYETVDRAIESKLRIISRTIHK